MAKLIVRPIDPRARGSYQVRAAVLTAINAAQEAGRRGDVSAAIQAQLALENMLIMRLSTDDGTPVEDALAELSADQFDDLFAALMFEIDIDIRQAAAPLVQEPLEEQVLG